LGLKTKEMTDVSDGNSWTSKGNLTKSLSLFLLHAVAYHDVLMALSVQNKKALKVFAFNTSCRMLLVVIVGRLADHPPIFARRPGVI
jgi:hypothetical protein